MGLYPIVHKNILLHYLLSLYQNTKMIHALSAIPQKSLDAIESAIAIKNNNGVILCCNKAFRRLFQLNDKSPVGLRPHDYLPEWEANLFNNECNELLLNKTGYVDYQIERQTQHGSKYISNIHTTLISTKNGSTQILVIISTSIQTYKKKISHSLTPREISILRLLVRGYTQKKIAQTLNISPHTVASYMKVIYSKLRVNNRTQAQIKAITELEIEV